MRLPAGRHHQPQDTYPYVDVREDDVSTGHEATVSKIGDDQLFDLIAAGSAEDEAMAMIARGFIELIAASCRWRTRLS